MAYATINKPNTYFNTVLYNGTGSTQSITGVNFKPDWVWIKERTATAISSHNLFDAVRGVQKVLFTNNTLDEQSDPQYLTSFNSDGFTIGTNGGINESGSTVVSWNWLAANSTTTNTSGTITSTVSANTTARFSIVSYTGTGVNATVGHGLGIVPTMIILKSRTDSGADWRVYHVSVGNTKYLELNTTAIPTTSSTTWQNTTPTSSVFSIGTSGTVNLNTGNFIAYCFADVKGFSKFGSYTGNGSTDGTFVYTGFKPAYIMMKRTDAISQWRVWDNKRNTYNVANTILQPNDSGAETTNSSQYVDLLSNGFKWRATYVDTNASGGTYIYACFAENPFVGTNYVPTTAR